MTTNKIIIQKLEIDFKEVDAGWITLALKLGKQKNDFWFSWVFDPIWDLKHWLEAIAIGVEQCSFKVDCEGFEVKFDLEKISWDKEELRITEIGDYENPYELVGFVDRKQIVAAFYNGLLSFRESKKYSDKHWKQEWEDEYLSERLMKYLKIKNDDLVSYLSELKRQDLKRFLFNTSNNFEKSKKSLNLFKGEPVKLKIGLFSVFQKENDNDNDWHIPVKYDTWKKGNKEKSIAGYLENRVSNFGGTKISSFRSAIIENYIHSNEQ